MGKECTWFTLPNACFSMQSARFRISCICRPLHLPNFVLPHDKAVAASILQ